MNRPFISMKHGLLRKNHLGGNSATALLRIAIVVTLISGQLFGLGMGRSFANGPIPRPGGQATPGQPPQVSAIPPSAQAGMVSLNFTGADLVEVIHVLAQYLKLNYTIDPGVRGTVTLYSAQPLRQQDLLPVFHQVLRMNDAVAVKSGEFYHIAPINAGKGMVRPARRLGERGYILQVVPIRFFSVSEMKRLLEPFVTPGGEILEYPRGNFLIILDLATNIQRLLEIKDLIDVNVFAGVRMELYQPKVASAEELADEMDRIMQAYAASATQSENFVARFIPVPRINRLLVISHSEAAWSYAMRWLERIDTYAEGPGRRIFVYPVENGKAVDLADILNQVLGQGSTGAGTSRQTLRDVAERIAGGGQQSPSGGTSAGQSGSGTGQSGSLYAVAPAQAPTPQTRPRPGTGAAPTAAAGGGADDQIRIVPDPATNSLIIFGTAQEFQNIRNILKEIDIVPRQVLMDVMIAEVTLSDDLRFGVEYQMLRDPDTEIFGRDFDQHVSILSGLPGALPGGAGPQALSMVIGTGDDIRGFINARKEDSRVKVLSSPTILATDNQPARIQVGTEEPIATGTVTSPVSTGVTSSTTIQYRNTGRILTIIPQVNAQGLVHLQVKTEVSQRGASVTVGQDSFPSFDTRDAETTAVVQDGETLAIGGIITERVNRGRVGVPFLMDIPVFGRFFGTTTDDVDRTELIMLITPHVIRNKEEARVVTEEFKDVLSHVVREYGWEIDNLKRQKRRGAEPVRQKAPAVKPQSSLTPNPQKPEQSARKATIVLPSDQQAYNSLTSSLTSSAPGKDPVQAGREVRTPSRPLEESQVVVLGNSGGEKSARSAKAAPRSDGVTTSREKVETSSLKAGLTASKTAGNKPTAAGTEIRADAPTLAPAEVSEQEMSGGASTRSEPVKSSRRSRRKDPGAAPDDAISLVESTPSTTKETTGGQGKDRFTDELLSAVIKDLEEQHANLYRSKESEEKTVRPDSPESKVAGSSSTQPPSTTALVPSEVESGEKVPLSTPGTGGTISKRDVTSSWRENAPDEEVNDPIAKDLLKEVSKEEKKDPPSAKEKAENSKTSSATENSDSTRSQKNESLPSPAVSSVQELKSTLGQMAQAPEPSGTVSEVAQSKASVKETPESEQIASKKTEELSQKKATETKPPAIKTGKEDEQVIVAAKDKPSSKSKEKGLKQNVAVAQDSNVAVAQDSVDSDKTMTTAPAATKPETKNKGAVVATNADKKPSKDKPQVASLATGKKSELPAKSDKSVSKERKAESAIKEKPEVKTETSAADATAKDQPAKVVKSKVEEKKIAGLKNESNKNDGLTKVEKKVAPQKTDQTKDGNTAAKAKEEVKAKSKNSIETAKSSAVTKESPLKTGDVKSESLDDPSKQKSSWSPMAWFRRSQPLDFDQETSTPSSEKPIETAESGAKEPAKVKSIPSGPDSPSVERPAQEPAKAKKTTKMVKSKVQRTTKAKPEAGTENIAKAKVPVSADDRDDKVRASKGPTPSKTAENQIAAKKIPAKENNQPDSTQRASTADLTSSKTAEKSEEPEESDWPSFGWISRAVKSVTSGSKETQDTSGSTGATNVSKPVVTSSVKDNKTSPESSSTKEVANSEDSKENQKKESGKKVEAIVRTEKASRDATERTHSKKVEVDTPTVESTVSSNPTSWSPFSWFQESEPVTSRKEKKEKTYEVPDEKAQVGTDRKSKKVAASPEIKEAVASADDRSQSRFSDIPLPENAESVTVVSIDKDQVPETTRQAVKKDLLNPGVVEEEVLEQPREKTPGGRELRAEDQRAPVFTNDSLGAYDQEAPSATHHPVLTETPRLEAEIVKSTTPAEDSNSKGTGWSPLGWWSRTDTKSATESTNEATELVEAEPSAIDPLSQEPGPVSPDELPETAETIAAAGGEQPSPSKKSGWSPLNWWSSTKPGEPAQEQGASGFTESLSTAHPDQTALGDTGSEDKSVIGGEGGANPVEEFGQPTTESQPSLDSAEISPLDGIASTAVGGEAAVTVESDPVAQKWLSTVGIRFEKKQQSSSEESASTTGESPESVIEENGFAETQMVDTPEVVSLVVPFDKESAEALRRTSSELVESPFKAEEANPFEANEAGQMSADVASETKHIESRVIRFPRHDSDFGLKTEPDRPWQEDSMRLAANDVESGSNSRATSDSFTNRMEPRNEYSEAPFSHAAKKHRQIDKSVRTGWSIQIRAYSRQAQARSLVRKLQNSGYDAFTVSAKVNGRTWYRVRVGHFDSKRQAKAILAFIRKNKSYSQAYVVVNR